MVSSIEFDLAFACIDPEVLSVRVLLWQCFFSLMRRWRIQIPLQVGDHRPASEKPFGVLMLIMAQH